MILELRDVSVQLGGRPILSEIDLDVVEGSIAAVLGPSGSGKTTLLRVVAGLQPSAGTVRWDGDSLDGIEPHQREFGLMFQDYALFPHRTVAANVAFGLEMRGDDRHHIEQRVKEVLGWVGLESYGARGVGQLSGGEQQRVALARALAPAPRLLMLDEPVGSLDTALRSRLLDELDTILTEQGITTLFVTHDQDEAFALADRVVIMREGRIVQSGTPEEIWQTPADVWTARFLGMTNIVSGFDGYPGPVVIRPEAIRLDAAGDVEVFVESVTFREGSYRVRGRTDDDTALTFESVERLPEGTQVAVRIDRDGVVEVG